MTNRWLVEYIGAVPFPVYATEGPFPTCDPWQAKKFISKLEAERWMNRRGIVPYRHPWTAVQHGFPENESVMPQEALLPNTRAILKGTVEVGRYRKRWLVRYKNLKGFVMCQQQFEDPSAANEFFWEQVEKLRQEVMSSEL